MVDLPAVGGWLKRHLWGGRAGILQQLLILLLPIGGATGWLFSTFVAPRVASFAVERRAAAHGVNLEVERWTGSFWSFDATAHDLTVTVPTHGPGKELLRVDELEVDLSPWTWSVQKMTARRPRLHLSRSLSGGTNWSRLARLEDDQREALLALAATPEDARHEFQIGDLLVEGLIIEWEERLPANSGGGAVQELTARLFLDDGSLSADRLRGLVDSRTLPTRFGLEGRVADGVVSVDSKANLFRWRTASPTDAESDEPDGQTGEQTEDSSPEKEEARLAWDPHFDGTVYLENLGATGLALLIPKAAIQPIRGSLTGLIHFELRGGVLTCRAEVDLRGFVYEANPDAPILKRLRRTVQRDLEGREINGRHVLDCSGDLKDDRFRSLQAIQTRITRSALSEAGRTVRAAALLDEARYAPVGEVDPELRGEVRTMARDGDQTELAGLPPEYLELARQINEISEGVESVRRTFGLPGGFRRP